MKFQNPSMHSSKVRRCIKVCNVKMPKMTKGHNSKSTFQNFIQKLIRSSTHHYQSTPQISRLYLQFFLRYFADKISSIFFQGIITQERGIILMVKKYLSAMFS